MRKVLLALVASGFLSSGVTGCGMFATPAADSLTKVEKSLEQAEAELAKLKAMTSPDTVAIAIKETEVASLKAKRDEAASRAGQETDANKAFWLSIFALLAGGLKLAEGIAVKSVTKGVV